MELQEQVCVSRCMCTCVAMRDSWSFRNKFVYLGVCARVLLCLITSWTEDVGHWAGGLKLPVALVGRVLVCLCVRSSLCLAGGLKLPVALVYVTDSEEFWSLSTYSPSLRACICVYACMCVCVYICVCVYAFMWNVYMCSYMCACADVCMSIYLSLSVCVYLQVLAAYIFNDFTCHELNFDVEFVSLCCVCVCVHICICLFVYIYPVFGQSQRRTHCSWQQETTEN